MGGRRRPARRTGHLDGSGGALHIPLWVELIAYAAIALGMPARRVATRPALASAGCSVGAGPSGVLVGVVGSDRHAVGVARGVREIGVRAGTGRVCISVGPADGRTALLIVLLGHTVADSLGCERCT